MKPARKSILIIDPEPSEIARIQANLTGYNTDGVTSTDAAAEILLEPVPPFDLVILDPQTSGPVPGMVFARTILTLYQVPLIILTTNRRSVDSGIVQRGVTVLAKDQHGSNDDLLWAVQQILGT